MRLLAESMSYWIIKEEEIDLRGLLDKQGLPGVDNDIMMCEKCFSGYFQKFFTAFKIECESILKKRDQEAEKLNRKQNETAHKLEEIKRSNFYFLGKMTKKVSGQIISKFHAFDNLLFRMADSEINIVYRVLQFLVYFFIPASLFFGKFYRNIKGTNNFFNSCLLCQVGDS